MAHKIFSDAERLRERSRYAEALLLYKKALAVFRRACDSEGVIDSLLSIGDTSRMVGDFLQAKKAYGEAISLSAALRDRLKRADAMVGSGLSLRALGEWKRALDLFSKARNIYKKETDKFGIAFTLWAEGGAFRVGGDLRSAISSFRKAKKIYESFLPAKIVSGSASCEVSDAQRAIGYCLCGLGGVSRVSGKFDDSLGYYEEANRLFSSIRDAFGSAYSHCGIGNALRMKSEYTKGMRHLRRAETIYRSIGDIVSYSYTIWSMGMICAMTGKLRAAEDCFEKAAGNFRKTRDVRGLIYCRLGLSELDMLRGDRARAKKRLGAALRGSTQMRFALEGCHSRQLLNHLGDKGADDKCYRALGSRLRFGAFPFNIP